MNNAAPENTAALQEKIAELEQQLKLSDEGASHLAERCLSLEQKVQSYLAAHPQREMHTDSPTLLQPLLFQLLPLPQVLLLLQVFQPLLLLQ